MDEIKKRLLKRIGEYVSPDPGVLRKVIAQQEKMRVSGNAQLLGKLLVEEGVVSSSDLEKAVSKQRLDRLQFSSVFKGISIEELMVISDFVADISVRAGQKIIVQDELGDCFYIIVHGEVMVYRTGDYEEEVPLFKLNAGESIGEMGYFSDGIRLASVRALLDTQLLKIKYADLEAIFVAVPSLTRNFLKLITERLRQTNFRFEKSVLRGRETALSLESIFKMLDMTEILSLRSGIESQIKRIVTTASKVMDAERATLFLLDRFSGELWSLVAEGLESREIRTQMGQGIAGWVAEKDQIVNIVDAYSDPRFDDSHDRLMGFKTRNLLCSPLKNFQGELIGVIQALNKRDGHFEERDEVLFKAFAYQTAIAVENLELYRRLLADHEKIAILFDVSTAVARTLDLDTLFVEIVHRISKALNAERSTLFLIDKKNRELWSKVAQRSELTEIRIPLDKGLSGYVAKTGEVLNIGHAYQDTRFLPIVDEQTGFKTQMVLCVPIVNRQGDIIGVTEVINKKNGAFDKEDENLLMALSSQISVALENAQLYGRTVDMRNYLGSVQDSITNSIVTLDNHYGIKTLNKAAEAWFREPMAGLEAEDIRDIFGQGNSGVLELIERVYASSRAIVDNDVRIVMPWGKEHFMNVNVVPLFGHKMDRQGLVLVFEDITSRKRMKRTLVRYMEKGIVEQLLNDPSRQGLGGTRSKATVMFADVRGYTSITENLTAEETVSFLNDYFSLMVDIIFQNKGVLDKYIGDAIMSVFGVPYVREDDALRAVRTAIQMRDRLSEFNDRRMEKGDLPIRIGIGICTGEVISGNIGSERRMDFTVIGDSVNVASRIEKLNKFYGTDILIGESTQQELKDGLMTQQVDVVRVKGKKKPVRIYEVLGGKGLLLNTSQEIFARGFSLYQEWAFEKAADVFAACADTDHLCRIFLKRCSYFKTSPPPQDWDGAWEST
ncbi:GAF domain-containing protein [Thermodesulfobacteriota bacterium]